MDGLITHPSSFGPKETMDRLEADVRKKGMTVFARVDHAAGASEVGLPLRATELLVFGNARVGTPLMQRDQTIGLDLPLKMLVWQDADGRSFLSYYDPQRFLGPHGIAAEDASVGKMTAVMASLAQTAIDGGSPPSA